MTTLPHAPSWVQPDPAIAADSWRDYSPEPFLPSLEEESYMIGLTVGREDGRFAVPASWGIAARIRYRAGRAEGTALREADRAYDLGRFMGFETGIPEPPVGFRAHEAVAYRAGFADAQAEMEEVDLRIDSLAESRITGLTDLDIHPHGYC